MSLNNAMDLGQALAVGALQANPRLIEALVAPSIWRPASVKDEPTTFLTQWQIIEATFDEEGKDKSRHFVGRTRRDGGRVSSAIVEFDAENMVGKTKSGRVYKLLGETGENGDANYVWGVWATRNRVVKSKDVSAEVTAKSETAEVAEHGGGSGG